MAHRRRLHMRTRKYTNPTTRHGSVVHSTGVVNGEGLADCGAKLRGIIWYTYDPVNCPECLALASAS